MTKHKHAEMIKAKADNMDLVVMSKVNDSGWKKLFSQSVLPASDSPHVDYFICHPKHADVCLCWLNGGDVQVMDNNWVNMYPVKDYPWEEDHDFMDAESSIRIKPRKEKRWIGIYRGEFVTEKTMSTPQDAREYVSSSPHYKHCVPEFWQFIEIEVEA